MRLYDLIKNDLAVIKENENKKDLKSLFLKTESTNKIHKIYNTIVNTYKEKSPNVIYTVLNDDLSNIETVLSNFETEFKDEASLIEMEIANEQKLDLSYLDNPKMDGYSYYALINASLEKTLSDYYTYHDPLSKNFDAIPNELLSSAKNELSKAIKNMDDDNINEKQVINDFIKNPGKNFEELKDNYNNMNNLSFNIPNNNLNGQIYNFNITEKEEQYLDEIDDNELYQARDLAPKILELIRKYDKDRENHVSTYPNERDDYPSLGIFLYHLKDKITDIATYDEEMELGKDKNGEFIKRFLNDPIKCVSDHLEKQTEAIEDNELFNNQLLVDEKQQQKSEMQININNSLKERLNNEKANYNRCASGKEDLWKKHQNLKANWFLKVFNHKMNNLLISDAIKNNKGGFFENLFGTTSKEYKAFSKGLDEMMKDGVEKGDLDGLRDKASDYLLHKLKSYDSINNTYDEKEFEKLDATGKGRVLLCLNVINTINDSQKAIIKGMDIEKYPANANLINKKVELDDPLEFLNKVTKVNRESISQDEFHKEIEADSKLENNIIKNDIKDEFEDKEIENDNLNNSFN